MNFTLKHKIDLPNGTVEPLYNSQPWGQKKVAYGKRLK